MSLCLETSSVLTNTVSTAQKISEAVSMSNESEQNASKNMAKIIVANSQSVQPVKVVNSPVITVVNTPGPITVVKSLCSNTTSQHFTLVNSSVKSPTITLVNAPPITVVKTISGPTENKVSDTGNIQNNNGSLVNISEKPSVHNVFVKKSNENVGIQEISQGHKILTTSNFPPNSVVQNLNSGPVLKTVNGQRTLGSNKLKILSNVVMQSNVAGPSNILLNKSTNQRYYQQPKLVGNGATKYINKTNTTNIIKGQLPKLMTEKPPQRTLYPTHKSQIKTIPPITNYITKPGIKTLSPQNKNVPGQVQRTGAGLRTIPPQRPTKTPNKPNYIGKHAIQAQKMRLQNPKMKTLKVPTTMNSFQNRLPQSSQISFNQALTAQILETLGHDSSKTIYETNRFETNYNYNEARPESSTTQRPAEYKTSNLDALSFVCQAVLLDHNYNATLPSELPTTPTTTTSQLNGVAANNLYSPGAGKRGRPTICSSNTMLSLSGSSLIPSNASSGILQDDDNASDISCASDHKDSEGEETDTAPEAEAVGNDEPIDRYGDYVTRCICGFMHDDGYMIECDRCKVWQHVRCVVRTKKVPDDYLCEECDPSKPIDRHKARLLQQQWMREVQARETSLRKEQLKEVIADSDSSDGEHINNNNFVAKSRRKSESQRPGRHRRESTKEPIPRRPLKRKEKKLTKRKVKNVKSQSDDEKREVNPQQLPQLRQWIENYEEAVTNHYSPELRARISSIRINGAHSELTGLVDPSVHKCKVHNLNAGVKCLISTLHLNSGTPVIELRGKYMLSTQHRTAHSGALTTRQQRPGPFLFFYRLQKDNTEVCVDTRTYGNIARFVRRSCQPNAELRHCIEKGVLHLYIVTVMTVEKNLELTIRHETHDLAVVGTTDIPCACGSPEFCTLNKIKKNGDLVLDIHRKRRGRRTTSVSLETPLVTKVKEELPQQEVIEEKLELERPVTPEINQEAEEPKKEIKEEPPVVKTEVKVRKEEPEPIPSSAPITTRRSSQYKSEEEKREQPSSNDEDKGKKLSREERKLQAIMKAIERMERQEQRKQEHQAKQAHRRESEPTPSKEEERGGAKVKRRKRKGRARTISTHSQQGRRNRLDSADSCHATSSDETLLSPSENVEQNSNKAAGLLLALANGENRNELKSPERIRDLDSNSNSSPETPLSSACLLVAAAVGPLEPGFKFPKTKKGLMNEWLNKGTDIVQSASSISPSSLTPHITPISDYDSNSNAGFYAPSKNLVALAQAATYCDTPSKGNAKKRWLRQAISEDQCDSPCGESPSAAEMVAPPKKRKLPRESISNDSPPTTPTTLTPPVSIPLKTEAKQEGGVEIITAEEDSPSHPDLSPEVNLNELAAEMRQEYGSCISLAITEPSRKEITNMGCLLDPRLTRDRSLLTSDQLVGTVEKTLSFLGYADKKHEAITPTKRKLSITEYRQRKRLNNNEKTEDVVEESPSCSQSPKPSRNRSNSTSSATSIASSDEDCPPSELPEKALSAFNSEPTELERQRESVTLRLKKAFGLSVDEDTRKPALNVETILKCDLSQPIKTTLPLSSPTFPIPGSSDIQPASPPTRELTPPPPDIPPPSPPPLPPSPPPTDAEQPTEDELNSSNEKEPVLFYTPDEEDSEANEEKFEKVESTSYVPPFNNPLYPNSSSYPSYGSVIDDDVPYEGRNPSPPPELGST